jgi:SAM-dependent methyltransferase
VTEPPIEYQLYDRISSNYASVRPEDPRIAARIHQALGDATTVVNVGAGTGNYEPHDRRVVAVEPSLAMIVQRTGRGSPVIQGVAEALPIRSDSADVAMAVLTLHHWSDLDAGLREMARVAPRQVIFLFDAAETNGFWGMEYFPEALTLPSERRAPDVDRLRTVLDITDCQPVPIPIDCIDGLGAAYWGRPEAYLDPAVQEGMSWLAQLPPPVRASGTARLAGDLRSGRWDDRFGHLRGAPSHDVGYKLVTARRAASVASDALL